MSHEDVVAPIVAAAAEADLNCCERHQLVDVERQPQRGMRMAVLICDGAVIGQQSRDLFYKSLWKIENAVPVLPCLEEGVLFMHIPDHVRIT